jgi:hypothetical protein
MVRVVNRVCPASAQGKSLCVNCRRQQIVGVYRQTVNVRREITSESRTDLFFRHLQPKQCEEVGKNVWIPPTLSDKTVGCAELSTSPAR